MLVVCISDWASRNNGIVIFRGVEFQTNDNALPRGTLFCNQIVFAIAPSLVDCFDIFQHMVDECFGISKACCPNFFSVSLLNMLDSLFIQHNLTGLVQPER